MKMLSFLLTILFPFFLSSYEFAIASMFRNEAPYLAEWIEYHKMIGADHFWLYNDKSTDNWKEVLAPYITEGLVEVSPWPTSCTADYTGNQCNAFKNALNRSKGIAKWLAFIDIDEFLLPMKEKTIPECLEKHFANTDAIYVNWRCFGSGEKYIPLYSPLILELTACSLPSHPRNCIGKSIVRPDSVEINQLWYPHHCILKEGATYSDGSGTFLKMNPQGIETDGRAHTNFIRINHYVMKDKGYFENVRLARAKEGYASGYSMQNVEAILQHNIEFSLIKDYTLINFIKKNYPEKYEGFWKKN